MSPPDFSNKSLTSTTYPVVENDHLTHNDSASSIGEPARKRHFEYIHLSAAGISMICLLLGLLTVTPNFKIAWSLRFSGQIVVLGFLLGIYGIGFPRIGAYAPPRDPIYLLTTSISPFLAASQFTPQPYPQPNEFPVAFGYNTLLLEHGSAAILDISTGSYVSTAQSMMSTNETWDVTATVLAYVASIDTTSDFRTNDVTWRNAMETNLNQFMGAMSTIYMYVGRGRRTGFLPIGANDERYFGLYDNSETWGGMAFYTDPDGQDGAEVQPTESFLSRTLANQSHEHLPRRRRLRPQDTSELGGNMMVFPYDTLPELAHVFTPYTGSADQAVDNAWLNATYAESVVTSYWARALFMIPAQGNEFSNYDGPYRPDDERIISHRATLNAAPLLYIVLLVQPAMTLLALAVIAWLYAVPIGRGFGIVSIVSGFDSVRSRPMRGAGFSGKLKVPVVLEVTTEMAPKAVQKAESRGNSGGKVRYRIVCKEYASHKREETRMRKGQLYG
ncbi:hypothetical protein H2200_012082 [Cladophialophora chaetospira]|uniref:Uncharacterized protein n=1 Tax=Cladophialophora chaetospira TaxID=386627 RepID=A0AA39CCJ7_9EURO|nr:hypothetical protein H2200_012082 [Cladophialophora chaetospira]